jgi:GTP-binding protein HflX
VGFIRKLPHSLVTSFRATLEEVERAELLLHVRDAASPLLEEQRIEVEAVLQELGAQHKPTLQVFNKIDLLAEGAATPMPVGAIPVSALKGEGLEGLLQAIDAALVADPLIEAHFSIPQSEGRVLAALERGATLANQSYEGNNVSLTAWGPTSLLGRYRRYQRNGENGSGGDGANNNTGRLSGERR